MKRPVIHTPPRFAPATSDRCDRSVDAAVGVELAVRGERDNHFFQPGVALCEADARTRTGDPFITSEVLYQLSYVGEARSGPSIAPPPRSRCSGRFARATPDAVHGIAPDKNR